MADTTPHVDQEQELHAALDAFSEAWSRGDAAAAADFFTDDGVRVGASGDTQRGRAELVAAYEALLRGRFSGAAVRQGRGTIRWLGADLALWQGSLEIVPPGAPALRGHCVQLMQKIDGRWRIVESHPKLFPPPPR